MEDGLKFLRYRWIFRCTYVHMCNVFHVHTAHFPKSVQKVFENISKCVPNVFQVCSRFILDLLQVGSIHICTYQHMCIPAYVHNNITAYIPA